MRTLGFYSSRRFCYVYSCFYRSKTNAVYFLNACTGSSLHLQPSIYFASPFVHWYQTCTLDANGCTEGDIPCFEDEGLMQTSSNGGSTNSASNQDGFDDSPPASETSHGTPTASIELASFFVVTASLLCVTVAGVFADYLMANSKASTSCFD